MIRPSVRPRGGPRDQAETGFTPILEALCRRVVGARGVALVDSLGETVDYAGEGDPFDFRVAAAHLQLLYTPSGPLGSVPVTTLFIRATRSSYFVQVLPEGYGLTLVLRRRVFWVSTRAVAVATADLREEAGWDPVRPRGCVAVEVEHDRRGTPRVLHEKGGVSSHVTLLGRVAKAPRGERSFRVRIDETSEETTLVREAGGAWYAERDFG